MKQERVARMERVDEEGHIAFCTKLIGQKVSVIMEAQTTSGIWEGLSQEYVRVFAYGDNTCAGKVRLIKVEKLYKDGVFGSFV